jgi:hypothetical protein
VTFSYMHLMYFDHTHPLITLSCPYFFREMLFSIWIKVFPRISLNLDMRSHEKLNRKLRFWGQIPLKKFAIQEHLVVECVSCSSLAPGLVLGKL